MTEKRNTLLFYGYFVVFLFLTSTAREFLIPFKQSFSLEYQLLILPLIFIVSIPFLIIIAKNSLYDKRGISWIAFSLIFIFFWDLSNYLPLLGFAIFTYLHHNFQITLPVETAPNMFRYAVMLIVLFVSRKHILLFFSALTATKKSSSDSFNFKSTEQTENYYSPKKSTFLFNERTGILSLVYKKRNYVMSSKHFVDSENQTFFTPMKGDKNPPLNTIKIIDNIVSIKDSDRTLVFLMSKLSQNMRKIITHLIQKDDSSDYVIIGETTKQTVTQPVENVQLINTEQKTEVIEENIPTPIASKSSNPYSDDDDDTMVVVK